MPEHSAEIEQVVRDWLDAKQAADASAIRAAVSRYEHALAIGTETGEWYAGADAFADVHAAGGPFTAAIERVDAHSHGAVGWAAVRAVIETGEPAGIPIRITVVLVREDDGRWRIAQLHASVPEA
jgi:ketosteroid isomerase-like protein